MPLTSSSSTSQIWLRRFFARFAPVERDLDDAAVRTKPVGRPRHGGLENLLQVRAFDRFLDLAPDPLVVNAAGVGVRAAETILDLDRIGNAIFEACVQFYGLNIGAAIIPDTQTDAVPVEAEVRRVEVDRSQRLLPGRTVGLQLGIFRETISARRP